jgi:hypothetical protein
MAVAQANGRRRNRVVLPRGVLTNVIGAVEIEFLYLQLWHELIDFEARSRRRCGRLKQSYISARAVPVTTVTVPLGPVCAAERLAGAN